MREKRRDHHGLFALDNADHGAPSTFFVSVHSTGTLSAEIWQVFIVCELQARSAYVFILREL
jgi:hypothetical protein